ncbi:MAG: hypothetical protein ACREOI_18790 [bacterium]
MRRSSVVILVVALLTVFAVAVMLSAQEKAAAKSETITGTLVDLKCYAAGGYLTNDHGDMKACGSMCATGGLPVGLVDANKKVHFLAVPAPGFASYVGQEIRFTGMHGKHADVFIPEKMEITKEGKWVEEKLPKTMM